jgi:EmrB/QacA subfamily drug resistance transporter
MRSNKWLTLTLVALGQFMVVLDVTIVNVALPRIESALHFSPSGLQWVISAYTLLFGGFLLLGGRVADLLGRRAVFVAGLSLFTVASLVAGLSGSSTVMIGARAVQGLGGALLSPAALSLLMVSFEHGRERNVALGIWGALAGLGGTLGVIAGGLLVNGIGWEWVFFVNVPIAVVALALIAIPESRVRRQGARNFDALGALLATTGLLALVFGVVRTQVLGWGSLEVIASLVAGIALIAMFVLVESRATAPLVPPRLFRDRGLRGSSLALAVNGAGFLTMFFLTAIFLQQVRGRSPLATGLELFPMGVAAILAAIAASQLVTRVGTRPVQATGALLSMVGLALLSRAGAHDAYASGLLPGFLLFGAGIVSVGVPGQIAAIAEVSRDDSGAASGVINAAYQIGGALGLAIITTIANSRVTDALHAGALHTQALTDGFQRGLVIAAGLGIVGFVLALTSPSIEPSPEQLVAAGAPA